MARKKKVVKIIYDKEETLDEFLARGGKIQHIDPVERVETGVDVKSTTKTPLIPIDLSTGAHYFAERIRRIRKERKFTGDISKLPAKLIEFLKLKGKL